MLRHSLAAFATLVLLGGNVFASIEVLQLHVKGLSCPFCVYGVEKTLKKLPGVESVETTIKTGLVEVLVGPDARVNTGALQEAITQSGFTLEHIQATITGRILIQEDRAGLEATGSEQTFLLMEAGNEGEADQAVTEQALKKLNEASAEGARLITITGRVHTGTDDRPALTVQEFEVAR